MHVTYPVNQIYLSTQHVSGFTLVPRTPLEILATEQLHCNIKHTNFAPCSLLCYDSLFYR